MNRSRVSHRTLLTSTLMLAAAVAGVMALSLLDKGTQSAQGSEPQVLLLASDDLGPFASFEAIQGATRVDGLENANAKVEAFPAVVVIDSAYAETLKSGDLRRLVASGSAVIGLGVPLSQLNDLTGFEDELQELNPRFAGHQPAYEKPAVPFFSLVWRTPEGANPARFSRSQQYLSDGFFERIIRDYKLKVQGLIRDDDHVIPLEEYGR